MEYDRFGEHFLFANYVAVAPMPGRCFLRN